MPARGPHDARGQTGRGDDGEDRGRLLRPGGPGRPGERGMNWVNAIIQGILLGGLYALFACGLSLLFGVVRVVNLAHGDFAVLAAYLALVVITTTHVPALLTFVIVAPLFALFGYGVQRLIIQKSLEVSPLTTLLVTFGLSVVIQNLLLVIASADSHSFDLGSLISASLRVSPELAIGYVPLMIFVTAVVVLIGLQLFLSRTAMGRAIRRAAGPPATWCSSPCSRSARKV